MPLVNPGFEQPGLVPGDARGWRVETVSTAITWAEFGTSTLDATVDGFESGWQDNDNPASLANIEFAVFDQAGEPDLVDDFERGWQGNENRIPDLGSMPVQDATFDQAGMPGQREDFERDWMSNEDRIPDLPSMPVQDAVFGDMPAPQAREQFDQQWAGVPGMMEPNMFFDFIQQVDFDSGTPDEISLDPPGDFVASGIRAGAQFSISGASKKQNNGTFVAAMVTPTLITLSTNKDLKNDNNELVSFQNVESAQFDGMNVETMEFAWNAMDEDF